MNADQVARVVMTETIHLLERLAAECKVKSGAELKEVARGVKTGTYAAFLWSVLLSDQMEGRRPHGENVNSILVDAKKHEEMTHEVIMYAIGQLQSGDRKHVYSVGIKKRLRKSEDH